MGKMRWFLMVGVILFSMALTGRAWALSLPPLDNVALIEFKISNYESTLDPLLDSDGDGKYDWETNVEDSWGIYRITSIEYQYRDGTTAQVWSESGTGDQLTGMFWGFEYLSVDTGTLPGKVIVDSEGGFFNVYEDVGSSTLLNPSLGTTGRCGTDCYTTATDGTLLFTAHFVPGIVGDPNVTLRTYQDGTAFPTTGTSYGYAAVDPDSGTMWDFFDLNAYLNGNADFYIQINTTVANVSDWDLLSNDPIRAAVPEPATLLLLGSGLLGVAGASRRMRRS